MLRLKIGLVLESLGLPLRTAIDTAGKLAVQGIQVDAVGNLAPDNLSQTGRKDFRNLLRSRGLELAALGCPLRHGFNVAENLEGRLEHVRKVLTLAYDLGPRLVVVYAGAVPPNENPAVRTMFSDSLISLGRHGERIGSTLALAAGMEPPATLAEFLRSLTCGGLGVNLDPGGLLMRNLDPYEAVRTFQDLVVYTHARDALADRVDRSAQEVPLGHGDVDWNAWFGALEEVAYHGWVTIRRGPSTDPVGDIRSGVAFLRRFVGGPVQ